MKEQRFLYETVVKRQFEEPVVEVKEENGTKIEIKRVTKKVKPVKVAILKPDRKLAKASEIFHARSISEYLKAGLLPYSLVVKRYANDGGPLSEEDKLRIKSLSEESQILQTEFFSTIGDDSEATKTKKNTLLVRINGINEDISKIQGIYSDLYESTAEIKARGDSIEWWSLFLILIDEGAGYKPLFGDGDYNQKVDKLEDISDQADPFYTEVIKRLSYLVSFWFAARNAVTKIDFETMEKLYIDTMSDYKVEEDKVDIKITDKTEPLEKLVTETGPALEKA